MAPWCLFPSGQQAASRGEHELQVTVPKRWGESGQAVALPRSGDSPISFVKPFCTTPSWVAPRGRNSRIIFEQLSPMSQMTLSPFLLTCVITSRKCLFIPFPFPQPSLFCHCTHSGCPRSRRTRAGVSDERRQWEVDHVFKGSTTSV